ncbi:MAG TPA: OB-fold nucleic acid binding domain-containing protein, partial [Actinopolymorphaceae bacterium]
VLRDTMDLVGEYHHRDVELATLPQDDQGVYDMLCEADSIGVFLVESRAQMATLPRLRPRKFYDLVIEVALIRPGPIQGGSVHPYIRRRQGLEPVSYLHPLLEPSLRRTLGVPLFQEQLMRIAMEVGGCSGDDADLLRRAMGSKRGLERISSLKQKLYAGMAERGIVGETADMLYERIEAFANFGFAESHSISFALLVYSSSWFKLHYPAMFLASLLRAQPMGFYSPQTLVADARRHGVEVRGPDLHRSGVHPDLEPLAESSTGEGSTVEPTGDPQCVLEYQPEVGEFDPEAPFDHARHRRDGRCAVRLGLGEVRSIGTELAERIVAEREAHGPYADQADLARRVGLTAAQMEALATAGAFGCLGLTRREALWLAGSAASERPEQLPPAAHASDPAPYGQVNGQVPLLPDMAPAEQVMADLWATGISPDDYPTRHVRDGLDAMGVVSAARLRETENGRRVVVGGVVTHRQRPATAAGVTFLNLEDETGMVNVICPQAVWDRHRKIARDSSALLIRGRVERADGVINVLAEKLGRLPLNIRSMSRDFH